MPFFLMTDNSPDIGSNPDDTYTKSRSSEAISSHTTQNSVLHDLLLYSVCYAYNIWQMLGIKRIRSTVTVPVCGWIRHCKQHCNSANPLLSLSYLLRKEKQHRNCAAF